MISHTIPKLTVSTAAGSDPDVIEMEDCGHAVGEIADFDDFDKIDPCPKNPLGHHIYSRDYFRFARCVHCHQPSGLER